MSVPFDRWAAAIAAAADEDSRRTLLGEILTWRKTQLFDVRAQRDAAWAASQLLMALGEKDLAIREAHGLVSLAQSPPEASPEELKVARRWLDQLRGVTSAPERARPARPERPHGERPARAERPERGDRPMERRDDPYEAARTAARANRWDDALAALADRRGPRFDLLRTWIVLARALQNPDLDRRGRDLFGLEEELRGQLLSERPERPERPERERPAQDHPAIAAFGKKLGGDIPEDRDALVEKAESLAKDVRSTDEIAAAALRHHVAAHGEREPAPWWITLVTRALSAGDGRAVKKAIAELGEAWAVTAYAEPAFQAVLDVVKAGASAGLQVAQVRRGIASRGEPKDRRIWTVRLRGPEGEAAIAVAASADEPYRAETADRLAVRLAELGIGTLYAPGPGNEGLLAAARSRGIATPDKVAASAWTMGAVPEGESAPRPPKSDPFAAVREALAADTLDADTLAPLISALPRVHRVFPLARDAFEGKPDAAARMATVLIAADKAAPPGVRLAEGTSIALEAATQGGLESPLGRLLVEAPTSGRYGGPGVQELLAVAGAARHLGFRIGRVLRGATLREKKAFPVVDALGESLDGLWRLLVQRDGENGPFRGEIWFVSDLSPEVRTAAPLLLQEEHPRAIVLAGPQLSADWASLGGPDAIAWGPDAEGALSAATDAWR